MALRTDPFAGKNVTKGKPTPFFNRVGYVELDFGADSKGGKGEVIAFKGLDFKFKISFACPEYPKGTVEVSILGLNQETINRITELTTWDHAMNHGKRVRVYAGYAKPEDPSYEGDLLCDMEIGYATPTTTPPEVWLTITGFPRFSDRTEEISVNLPDRKSVKEEVLWEPHIARAFDSYKKIYTFEQLCKDVVRIINDGYKEQSKQNGSPPPYEIELDFQAEDYAMWEMSQFMHTGTVADLIKKMNDLDENHLVKLYFESRKGEHKDYLVVKALDSAEDSKGKGGTAGGGNLGGQKTTTKQILDVEHGLIGLPSLVQGMNLQCRSLLSPNLKIADWIELKSVIIPKMNGYWRINEVTHSGHFRGNEWYTDINAKNSEVINLVGDSGSGSVSK